MHNKRFVRLYNSLLDKQRMIKTVKEFDWNHNRKIKKQGLGRTRWKYFCEKTRKTENSFVKTKFDN